MFFGSVSMMDYFINRIESFLHKRSA